MEENQALAPSLLAMRLNYDVFLSFRGEDTRHTFTARLYSALSDRGVRTFIDHEGLEGGDEISPSLLEAIHDSAASVAVISPRYADSRWCLEELATLFDCQKLVVPVFYRVDPSHVRRQTGPFGEAFRVLTRDYGHQGVLRWKQALCKAGNLSGSPLTDHSDESREIQKIVNRILKELATILVRVATYPVGLCSRVENVFNILNLEHNGVRFLGIHGKSGIGKTTLAKAVFSKLVASFKRRCFIANFKETLEKEGVLFVQNTIIRHLSLQTLHPSEDKISGKTVVRRLINNEDRVLVVLDDVVGADELEAVGIQRRWFSEGSRLISTSRDRDRLCSFVHEDELYEAEELHDYEALELFILYALRRKKPTEELRNISVEILSLAGRLPLAIEVFGSVLLEKKKIREWETTLEKFRRIRPSHFQDVLKFSYDELDNEQKCIFLDISCLFVQVGMKRADAIDLLLGCGFNAEEAIEKLMKKSLLKVTLDDVLWMHDQIRDMGRQIVIEEDVEELGNRSRLWNYDDVVSVLTNNMGTDKVRGIILDAGRKKSLVNFGAKNSSLLNVWRNFISYGYLDKASFQSLVKLKLLQIDDMNFRGDFNYMPPELRWLKWKECPWKSLPSTFPRGIRVLDLSESKIERLWSSYRLFSLKNQVLKNLTVLNLNNCYYLTSLPYLSGHCKVKKLTLEGCVKLREIHESLGHMTSLIHLNLRRCTSLVALPSDISGLKQLKELILSSCNALTELPCDLSSLKSLIELHLDHTGVTELPSLFHLTALELMMLDHCTQLKHLPKCIGNMRSLKILSLYSSGVQQLPDSVGSLQSLEQLKLGHCLSLENIPDSVGKIKSLSTLHLSNSPITQLPDSCCSLPYLNSLSLAKCPLQSLPASINGLSSIVELRLDRSEILELPDEIGSLKLMQTLEMVHCTSLKKLPESVGDLSSLSKLNLSQSSIVELPESIGRLENLITLRLNKCTNLCTLPISFGELKSLCHLWMEETTITELPENIGNLSELVQLKMKKKENITLKKKAQLPGSFGNLFELQEFDAHGWNISEIPENFKMLSLMETLDLGYNIFKSLPSNLEGLLVLQKLQLSHCHNLELLPSLPSSLIELNATNCCALCCLPDISNLTKLVEVQPTNCGKLQDVPGLEHLRSLRQIYMAGCNASSSAVRKRLSKEMYERLSYLCIPGSRIPGWFSEEAVVYTSRMNSTLTSVIIGAVLSIMTNKLDVSLASSPLAAVQVKIIRMGRAIFSTAPSLNAMPSTSEDQLYLCRFKDIHPLVSLLEDGDKIEVSLLWIYDSSVKLKRRGIHLVYENDDNYDGNEDLLEFNQQSVSKKLSMFFQAN